nr:ABC transporter permease [Actinomycetota bacterium]
ASGVVEEKASRVVEILLAKARPGQLLAGKVIGIGLLGLIQLVAFVVIGLVTAGVTGSVDLPPETVPVAVQVVLWFVLGFALYSCLFAVGGAMASRVEELQSTTTPLTFLAVASLFAAMNTGGNPTGRIAEIATFIPFSAPMVLPIRIAAGEVALGTVLLAVAIVLVSIVAAMMLAARVYAGGALHLRGQLGLRKALRAG